MRLPYITDSNGLPVDYTGLDWVFRPIVDTVTESVTEFEFRVDSRGTWTGTGGTAFFNDFGPAGTFRINVSPLEGGTYTSITDGFTPTLLAGPIFELPIGLYGDFVDGFPTTIDVAQSPICKSASFISGSSRFIINPVLAASGTEIDPTTTPEPSAGAALAAIGALAAYRRKKSQRNV